MNKLDIIGQTNVVFYLNERLKSGSLPNTMLFSGPSGVGKTTMAKRMAIEIIGNKTEQFIDCISNGVDTDEVKFFNMSVLKSDEEVKKVISNFTPSISGKKVLILDECHGMTAQQQDALLIQLESLDNSIYVIMCTTDEFRLNDSLIGRMNIVLRFTHLSKAELVELSNKLTEEYNINFENNKRDAISNIVLYSNGDARVVQKIFEELKNLNCTITEMHLEALLGDLGIVTPIILLTMLHTNIAQALNFVDKLHIGFSFRNKCAKLLCVLNGTNEVISINEQKMLQALDKEYYDIYFNLICDILDCDKLDNAKLISLIYKYSNRIANSKMIINERLLSKKDKSDNIKFEEGIKIVNEPIIEVRSKSLEEIVNSGRQKGFDFNRLKKVNYGDKQDKEAHEGSNDIELGVGESEGPFDDAK